MLAVIGTTQSVKWIVQTFISLSLCLSACLPVSLFICVAWVPIALSLSISLFPHSLFPLSLSLSLSLTQHPYPTMFTCGTAFLYSMFIEEHHAYCIYLAWTLVPFYILKQIVAM